MLRKTMIALCAVASVGMLAPDMAMARGGGGGGGGGHGGGGGFGGGRGGGGWGGGGFGARGFSGGNFSSSFARAAPNGGMSSFARATPNGAVGAVQSNRFASSRMGRGFDRDHDHGFRHRRGFFVGDDFFAGDYWDYPDYAYDDSYYDNGNCYVVQRRVQTQYGWRIRPVQVCG
jgi:hypothetical protein